MDFYELIQNRESVRDYDRNRPVEQLVLNRILNAGRLAPSAANRQPWTFVLVSSQEMLDKVRPCYDRPWFHDAPHILIIVGNKSQSWVRHADGYNSIETDLAIAMDHIILAAEYEGLGTCWIEAYDPRILAEALSLKENELIFSVTPLGYPGKDYQKKTDKIRKPLGQIVKIL